MKKLNFSDYKNLDETLLQKEKSNRKISESISFIFFMSIFLAGISSLIIDISPKCSRLEYSNNCVSNLIHIDQKYSFLFAKKTSNYIHLSDAKQLYQAISLNRIYYKYSLTSGQKKILQNDLLWIENHQKSIFIINGVPFGKTEYARDINVNIPLLEYSLSAPLPRKDIPRIARNYVTLTANQNAFNAMSAYQSNELLVSLFIGGGLLLSIRRRNSRVSGRFL